MGGVELADHALRCDPSVPTGRDTENTPMQKALDQKLARILRDPSSKDFIIADAKDAGRALGGTVNDVFVAGALAGAAAYHHEAAWAHEHAREAHTLAMQQHDRGPARKILAGKIANFSVCSINPILLQIRFNHF